MDEPSTEHRPEDDYPPTHRRWWRWWMEPGFAEEEWRELTLLAAELKRAGADLKVISRGMGDGLAGKSRVASMGSALVKMGQRWERRSEKAEQDAIADHGGDQDWEATHFSRVQTDLAEDLMARGINALIEAERHLDRETVARVQKYRKPLQDVYAEVHDRDPLRRARAEAQY